MMENKGEYNNDDIDQLLEAIIFQSPAVRNEPPLPILSSIPQLNVIQSVSSPEIKECGWTSPPRTIIVDYCSRERLSSKPSTTMNGNIDPNYQLRVIDTDTKPMRNITNNILQFAEQFQNELEQIKDEYRAKFTRDRNMIEHEINRLINDERMTLGKLERRRNSTKSSDYKRKH